MSFGWLLALFNRSNQEPVKVAYPNDTHISPNFLLEEVLPPGVLWTVLSKKQQENLLLTANLAESLRAEVGYACSANTYPFGGRHQFRGFRLKAHQQWLIRKGFTTTVRSKHRLAGAIDLECKEMDLFEFAEVARKYFNTVLIYPKKGFIHCDIFKRGGKKFYKVM